MHRLNQRDLELAAMSEFSRLGCYVEEGPPGGHDLLISFPCEFNRKVANGLKTTLGIDKTFVVEVKSHEKRSAQLDDLRQLQDWVRRESARNSPSRLQKFLLNELKVARSQVENSLNKLADLKSPSDTALATAVNEAQAVYGSLETRIEQTLAALLYRCKGIFLINHQYELDFRSDPFSYNIRQFAEENRLVLIDWLTLLETSEQIASSTRDPLDFWCSLYETSGIFKLDPKYSWKDSAEWCGSLFDHDGCSLVSGRPFLMPLPRFS